MLPNIHNILAKDIKVTITVSLDGIGKVHDYVRWPIKWETVQENINNYKNLGVDLNTWTTVHALNIGDLDNIRAYVKQNNINHSWALLEHPEVLNVKYRNEYTSTIPEDLKSLVAVDRDNSDELRSWIMKQDALRGIQIKDYL
jgi:sulfatase maturation enzyme AslB (radical SAM superfamily)